MTEFEVHANAPAPDGPATAGALLRAAREAAGLTIDAVAQQLKLAPRQVKAIEDSDFTLLPGRTFVRGFVRNYARLVRLDPEPILGALPAAAAAPTLETPALQPTAPSIGELPTAENGKPSWARWAIPVTLVAIIGATVAYEQMRAPTDTRRSTAREMQPPAQPDKTPAPAPEIIGAPLPNPMTSAASPPAATAPASLPLPATREPERTLASTNPPAPTATPTATVVEAAPPASAAAMAPNAPLVLAFRDFSWTEVKDRNGTVVLSRMNAGGTTQAIAASPPLDLVIGNAADVTLTWKGQRVDLAPHTRQNVARLRLQ